jgi:arylsulfatase A-like enzyme
MKIRLYQTWLIITSGTLWISTFTCCSSAPEVQSPPNIVLIMADDVDYTNFSCYGGRVPTPAIDRLAAEGMRFQEVHTTASACTPSRFSVMTGLYPGRSQHPDFLEGQPLSQPYAITWNTPVTESNTTIHEALKPAYFTGYVGKFHIGSLKWDTPESNPAIPNIPEGLDLSNHLMPDRSTYFQQLEELGIAHGEGVPDHINHYNIGTLYLDAQIEALLRALEDRGLAENTLVILTADHNLEPGKSTVYEKGLKVPFLLRWPGQVEAGSINDDLISFVDLLPTLSGVAQITENQPKTDGVDWSGALFRGATPPERAYLYPEEGYTRAVTDGRWKYIAMRFPDTLINQLKNGNQKGITHLGQPILRHPNINPEDQ